MQLASKLFVLFLVQSDGLPKTVHFFDLDVEIDNFGLVVELDSFQLLFVVLLLENEFLLERLILFLKAFNLDLLVCSFCIHFYHLHLTDTNIFFQLRLKTLHKFVISHYFAL